MRDEVRAWGIGEMSRKLWVVCIGIAVLFSVYIYLLVDGPTKSKEATIVARDAAMQFLLHPNEGTIKISGNRSLVDDCIDPHLETTYSLSEKGRFEFRVRCANKTSAFMLVAMRRSPPDFIAISQQSLFGASPRINRVSFD